MRVNFGSIDSQQFLREYWQKKPLVIRKALPGFINPLTPDELAGLAMEEEIESRIVLEAINQMPSWRLKRGPFIEKDFTGLPETHWTLLVQGVDRFIPEVAAMLDYFNFIPQWRVDDVMISYAARYGSVGPHYDNYDVFLYQAIGQRRWSLTTKNCQQTNYLPDTALRIMAEFDTEEEYLLEEGDMLYLPPHVGHYGVATTKDCMTYSFGYRSYQGQELWNSFADYLTERSSTVLYEDPDWSDMHNPAELPRQAWLNARDLLQKSLNDENLLKSWFGCFITQLDEQAETLLPGPLASECNKENFVSELAGNNGLMRNAVCRFAYHQEQNFITLFINGKEWNIQGVSPDLIKWVANNRFLTCKTLHPFLKDKNNLNFLFELWQLQWLELY
ncbi:cupin domain-containing protein [Legionella fairfieldensis]|uniref:cupin domain-containing protein n=1 Tax=Legionella fairfieldensis TaxID=45064 RepID=UPI00055D2CBF|nr:cupin domain-containing protein [Legionella fairfieldensis]